MADDQQLKERTETNCRIGRSYPITKSITVESKRVTSQSIKGWATAIQSAKSNVNPRRKLLYDMYDTILMDGHLESVMEKFVGSVANKRLVFSPYDDDADVNTELIQREVIDQPWFRDLIKYRMEAKSFGHSLVELILKDGKINKVELVNRLNVVPETGWLAKDYYNLEGEGIAFRHDPHWSKYLVEFGKERDLGKLLTAAQYVIYKRGAIGDYAQCVELFGMPFREARYNPFNPNDRALLEEAMSKAGAAAYAVIPEGSSIEFHQNNPGTGGYQLFMGIIKEVCNEELSKLWLGNTMTTEDGASRSQGETHKAEQDELMTGHLIETELDLNFRLKDVLTTHGIPDMDKGRFMFQESSDMPLDKRIEIDEKLWNTGAVDFPENYWHKTYGIPVPDKNQRSQKQGEEVDEGNGKKPKPKDDAGGKPKGEEKGEDSELSAVVAVGTSCCADPRHSAVVAAYTPNVTDKQLMATLFDGKGNKYDQPTFKANANKLVDGLMESMQPSMAFGGEDTKAAIMMELNIYRFSFNKNLAQVLELNKAVKANPKFEDFRKEAAGILGKFNDQYLRTEHNMAMAVGQNSRDYLRILDTVERFPYVRYRTVGDDNVRQSHAALDGRLFKVADSSWRQFVPPNGYNCRCSLESVAAAGDDEKVSTGAQAVKAMGAEHKQMRKEGFAVNRAAAGEVFDLGKEYVETLGNLNTDINKLSYQAAGLPSFKQMKGRPSIKMPVDAEATADSVKEAFEASATGTGAQASIEYKDYSGKPMRMLKGALKKGEPQLFRNLGETLEAADEVYMQQLSDKRYGLSYVQHFNDAMMVAEAEVVNGELYLRKWYSSTDDKVRKGLLIR